VAEIQRKIVKRGKRNLISRLFHAKNDKETIATWRLGLNRVLHVFNVRSTIYTRPVLNVRLQTELGINTHVVVSDIHEDVVNTHTIVSDVHRDVLNAHTIVSEVHHDVTNTHTVVSDIYNDVVNTHNAVSDVHQGVVNTHAIVSDLQHNVTNTQTIVSDIRRTMVKSEEGTDGKNQPVSAIRPHPSPNKHLPLRRPNPGQRSQLLTDPVSDI